MMSSTSIPLLISGPFDHDEQLISSIWSKKFQPGGYIAFTRYRPKFIFKNIGFIGFACYFRNRIFNFKKLVYLFQSFAFQGDCNYQFISFDGYFPVA